MTWFKAHFPYEGPKQRPVEFSFINRVELGSGLVSCITVNRIA
jgi:hypothetical protein